MKPEMWHNVEVWVFPLRLCAMMPCQPKWGTTVSKHSLHFKKMTSMNRIAKISVSNILISLNWNFPHKQWVCRILSLTWSLLLTPLSSRSNVVGKLFILINLLGCLFAVFLDLSCSMLPSLALSFVMIYFGFLVSLKELYSKRFCAESKNLQDPDSHSLWVSAAANN